MSANPNIDLQNIEATIALQDPVLRNLQITQTYSDINLALSNLLGRRNVSWCAYATWASKTAGKFIRLDNIDHTIDEFLRGNDWVKEFLAALPGALTWFGWKVKINASFFVKTLNETAQEASKQVAEGNLLVFSELAPLYEKFIRDFSGAEHFKQEDLDEFLIYLESQRDEKQDNEKLKNAYTAYCKAIFEQDSKARAELIFLANLLVGFHEQIRLDRAINNSLNAPIEQLFRKKIAGSISRWLEGSIPRFLYFLIYPYLKIKVEPVINRMAEKWRVVSTELLMRIEVPDGHLDLSEDIPVIPYSSKGFFPKELETIEKPELQEILKQLDFTPNSTGGSGAKDWGKISDRMNFIADFFRTAQQDEKLFLPPFNREQTYAIKNGQLPAGKL